MTSTPIKLGLQQRVLAGYRLPFFELLAQQFSGRLCLFTGDARPDEMIESGPQPEHFHLIHSYNLHLLKNRFYLCWQVGIVQWLQSWNPDVLILEANPRYISQSPAIHWMHQQKRAVIGWGLGAPPMKGPLTPLRKFYRKRFISQFDAIITYSYAGAASYRAAGVPPHRIFVACNAVTRRPSMPFIPRPDRSPSSVTALMSVGAKAAGFAALVRVFILALPAISNEMMPLMWGLSVLTMVIGNIAALSQKNIKRLLAYSSIAQSGYILMAFLPYGNPAAKTNSLTALLFYLAAYAITTFAAWSVVISLEKTEGRSLEIEDYAGLGKKHPGLALVMMLAMLSFTGVPLTVGFWGKFYLFAAAVQGGQWLLATIGILASVISAYYYLRLVVIMYMKPGAPQARRYWLVELTSFITALAIVALGFAPWTLLQIAEQLVARM